MSLSDIGSKVDRGLSGLVHLLEGIAAWWRASLPKWFRFIFFYGTMPVWFPVLAAAAIPLLFIGFLMETVMETWRDFD